jgi:two-component sensor histidine kinase
MTQQEQDKALIAKLQLELAQKDDLLREAYHRIKNNLQVVLSFLSLQAGSSPDPKLKDFLLTITPRIQAMALVHQMLNKDESLAHIPLQQYIKNLIKYLYKIYQVDTKKIPCILTIDDISLEIDRAIPCGLIINELVSNIFKYAFPENQAGEIKVSLKRQENQVILMVSDNGIGMKTMQPANNDSLGIQLVTNLTKQLDGEMKIEQHQGTCFTIVFKLASNLS